MLEGIRNVLAKRLLRQLIEMATQTLYSERFDLEPLVARMCRNHSDVASLRAYVAIETAARLTEPLAGADVDRAFATFQRSEAHSTAPTFRNIVEVHRELAEHFWSSQHLAILRRKLAYKQDEYSYEGTIYRLQSENKGPVTLEQRAEFEPICKRMADLNRQIEEAELAAWKKQDDTEHQRYKEDLKAGSVSAEIDANEDETLLLESAEVVSMLEATLKTLLNNDETTQGEVEGLRRDLALLEDPETICSFGQMAFDGDGVEQDHVAAANWFRIAAEQGNSRAQHNLALMYESGEGVPQDYNEAAKWYHMAAEQENPGSQNNLGSLYETGEGVTQDYAVALEWYRRAAEGGDSNAPANFKRLKPRAALERYQSIDRETVEVSIDYPINENNWVAHLTEAALAHWQAKPQSSKDWWYANTKPEDRGGILRTEIGATKSYNEFLHLPEATRHAITERLEREANEARIRLRQRGFAIPEQAPRDNDETPAA